MERTLVTGARGMLGRVLVEELSDHCAVTCVDVGDFDITDETLCMEALSAAAPDIVINCAGYTDVDGAESHPQQAHAVNGTGAGNIARAAAAVGARLLHVSTEYVFDGSKDAPYEVDDPTGPLNVYGASKLAGEQAVMTSGAEWTIVRTAWLYGHGGRNFVETILRVAQERGWLEVVDDQRGAPTCAKDLAVVLRELAEKRSSGIVHATNSGQTTWFGFAQAIVAAAGLTDVRVSPVATEGFPRPAVRPRNSVLSLARLREILGWEPRPWLPAVEEYIAER